MIRPYTLHCLSYFTTSSEKKSSWTPAWRNISSDSAPAWYLLAQTTLAMPQLMMIMAQVRHGVIRQ